MKIILRLVFLFLASTIYISTYSQQQVAKPPYPIVFMHGWAGSDDSWKNENGNWQEFLTGTNSSIDWECGGTIHVCLNSINDTIPDIASDDVELVSTLNTQVTNGDFYFINFNVNKYNEPYPDNTFGILDNLGYINNTETTLEINLIKSCNNIHLHDIIAIDDELMEVIGINTISDVIVSIEVRRHVFNTSAAHHWPNSALNYILAYNLTNESNQASIVRGGLGIKKAIDLVKDTTGADKVILIAHSMGGLNSRQYIQNSDVYEDDVVKLITISTPHQGSNKSNTPEWIGEYLGVSFDLKSSAVRDMRYRLLKETGVPSDEDDAPFLFDGESEDCEWDEVFNFYCNDMNGDGDDDQLDIIEGLNSKDWPNNSDILIHFIFAQRLGTDGDDIVDWIRQVLPMNMLVNVPVDNIEMSSIDFPTTHLSVVHTGVIKEIDSCMIGLDEPDNFNQAYQLLPNTSQYTNGFITYQAEMSPNDIDFYKFESNLNGQATVKLVGPPDPDDWNLKVYKPDGDQVADYELDESSYSPFQIPFEVLDGETYTISFESVASATTYNSPYKIKVSTDYNPAPTNITTTSNNYVVNINNPVTISTIVTDQNNNNIEGQVITFASNESGNFSSGNQAITNSLGVASITYTPLLMGDHFITATASNNESGSLSQPIVVSDPNFGHDLKLTRLILDDEWLTPGQDLDFSFDVRNPGQFTESSYTIQYQLKDQYGTVLESDSEAGIPIDEGEILPVFNSTLSISSGYSDGFYDICVEVILPGDCAQGNNLSQRSVYIGDENPFQTYLMESSDVLLIKNTNNNLGGYNVKFTAHDANTARVIVDGEQRDIAYDEFSFFDAFQFNLIYKGYFSSTEAAFRYAQPSSLVSFSPQKLVIEAGKTGTFNVISNEEDPTPSIDVTLEGGLDGSIVQGWNSNAYTFGTPYSNVYYDLEVPLSAERREYDFWVKMVADGQFYQRLSVEVIDPIPDFTYSYNKSLLNLAPGMTDSIRLILQPHDGFNESVLLNIIDLPANVSCIITNSNLLLPDTSYIIISVDPSFNSFDYYNSSVSLVSNSRSKLFQFALDIVDISQNNIEITSVEYFDANQLLDSLKINFNSQFVYSSTAQTKNWQYTLDSETWVDIPASEITNNILYSQGSSYINWEIPYSPALFSTTAKFRMNQKSGPDFLMLEYQEDFNSEDFFAIMYWNNVLYVLDDNTSKVYRFQYSNHTFTYLGKFSISVPNGKGEEFVHCYNKIYLTDLSDEDVWVFNSSWGLITHYNISVDWGAMFKMDDHLYFHDDELNLFVEVDQYLNQTGTYYDCPYPYYTSYGFFDGKNIWLGEGNDLYKVSNDYQTYEHFGISRGMDAMCIVGDELISATGNDDLYVYNFNNPYSFYTTSAAFTLNNTFHPIIDTIPDFITIENSPLVGQFNLIEKISDQDTPTENLTISLLPGNGADVQFNAVNDSLIDIIPDPDWFGHNQFVVSVYDGFSTVERTVNVFILEENHNPVDFSLTSPLSGVSTSSTSPTFTWSSSSDPDPDDFVYYTLIAGTDPSFSVGTFNIYDYIFDTDYTINDYLIGETIYYWKVKANDNEGGIKWSSEVDWWFETPIAVLENINIENQSIDNTESNCYNATDTITVAGSGTTVDIQLGGEATFIAGEKIIFEPGFKSHVGSYCNAYITLTGDYCSQQQSLNVEDVTINSMESECFDAINIITVAGSGTTVDIQSGGEATFIAGEKIIFEPGFTSYLGSYCNAYITLTGDYCSQQPMMASSPNTLELEKNTVAVPEITDDDAEIKIYPNPTTGHFTIDFMGKAVSAEIQVLNLQGRQVFQTEFDNQIKANIDISHLPGGMYIIVIKSQMSVVTERVIKTY